MQIEQQTDIAATSAVSSHAEGEHPVERVLRRWHNSPLARHFCCYHFEEPRSPESAPLPDWLDPRLRSALAQRGITRLYSHQAEAIAHAAPPPLGRGRDVVIATPTASGKTLCYNLPVFETLARDPRARALYLFPTKALARDQIEAGRELARASGIEAGLAVYDGDTPPDERRAARRAARIIATNPDMLHASILPHHPNWAELLSGLRYVVVDELHVYRGVFGSHLAHVLRRLVRLARFHGAEPTFVFSSATIANPCELAQRLCGRRPELVERSGAPRGARHFLIYNPPVVDPALGLRESYLKATSTLTQQLLASDVSSLVFCRSRKAVEVLLRYLRDGAQATRASDDVEAPPVDALIRGYR
ncbi:MAG: DEAD/DEAH box helicase, partial [Myxococcales bacterium]|nr:DEAD/DEAH box helicase [Myxococcales bacterium]